VAGALLSAALALSQWLGLNGLGVFLIDQSPASKPYANLAQPNHLATLLALGTCGILRWYESRRLNGPATALSVAFLAVAMLTTQSRTGWLFVGLLVLAVQVLHTRARLRLPIVSLWVGAALFAVGVLAWQPLNDLLLLRSVPLAERLHAGSRVLIWRALLDAVWQSPWVGYGWTQVGLAQQATALDWPPVYWYFRNSHNLLLDLVLWNGVALGVLLFGLLVAWFVRRWRSCGDADTLLLLIAVS